MRDLRAVLVAVAIFLLPLSGLGQTAPIPRKDAFLGFHFDLHPTREDTSLGADVSEENVERFLRAAKPDFVQYDCKGHPGYTGYPTKVGYPSPGIVKDALRVWRDVTRRQGVGLYIHYSGVWDSVAVEKHPEWARRNEKGKPDQRATSTFGPYVDRLMIPQLKEVISAYELDGVWVDGDCWAAQLDYGKAAVNEWRRQTGHKKTPRKSSDPLWLEWKMFHRARFEQYLGRWVDAVHAFDPRVQLTSNWMYTTQAPKAVTVKLDFLSGDYSPLMSVERARLEARYLASVGMPWDLMAWGFNRGENVGWTLKPAVHLQQEAAAVIMQGGGFQTYFHTTRAGLIPEPVIKTAAEVAAFCRERQSISHKSRTIPQIAVLLSSETHWDRSNRVFGADGYEELEGALHALLESHYSVDVLAEHQLEARLNEFPVVVAPDSHKLAGTFRESLLRYVRDGGSLLLLGEQCARLFEPHLGAKLVGWPRAVRAEVMSGSGLANADGIWQPAAAVTAEVIKSRYSSAETRSGEEAAATLQVVGRGKIAAVYGPVALAYYRSHHPHLRKFIGEVAERLLPEPAVRLDGPACVELALRTTPDGRLSVHLMNRANVPLSARYTAIDFIPGVGPLVLKIRAAERPSSVRWMPGGQELEWSWENRTISVTVPSLRVHGVVVVS